MMATRNYIFTNKYIPQPLKADPKYFEQDLNTRFIELKFKEVTGNPDQYLSDVKFINFNIIYSDIRKSQLQKPLDEYQTIHKNDFDGYNQKLKDEMVSAAHRSECTDIFFEKDLGRKHFFDKYPTVELSAMKKGFRKKTTDSCKPLPF